MSLYMRHTGGPRRGGISWATLGDCQDEDLEAFLHFVLNLSGNNLNPHMNE